MKSAILRTALLLPAITVAGAIAFTLPPSRAAAQASPGGKADARPAAVDPDSSDTVGGVVVQTPRPRSKIEDIPPDKAAAFDAEVAKAEAWKRYRKSAPPLAGGTLGLANDYPGLQSLLPARDDAVPEGPVPLR